MIDYKDIFIHYPNTRFIAYHCDNLYHYAVGITNNGYNILHLPITAFHVATHTIHIPHMSIHTLQRTVFLHEHITIQLHLYNRYYNIIQQLDATPTVHKDSATTWSILSRAFGVPPEHTVIYLGAAAFATPNGNIDWACNYQLTW